MVPVLVVEPPEIRKIAAAAAGSGSWAEMVPVLMRGAVMGGRVKGGLETPPVPGRLMRGWFVRVEPAAMGKGVAVLVVNWLMVRVPAERRVLPGVKLREGAAEVSMRRVASGLSRVRGPVVVEASRVTV